MEPNRTLSSIRTYVVQDLADAAGTTIEDWLNTFLGVNAETFREWRTKIDEEAWFDDPAIQTALTGYCYTTTESKRYEPFIALLNRIIDLGRGNVNHDGEKTFPIDDLHLMNHSNKYVHANPEQGNAAACRKPDIVLIRKSAIPEDGRVLWTDILTWFELKVARSISQTLIAERSLRGKPKKTSRNVRGKV